MRRKRIILLFVFLLFIVASWFVTFYFFYNLKEYSDVLTKEDKELKTATLKREAVSQIKDYKRVEKTLEEAYELFVDSKKPLDTILFLEEIAEENNLSITIDTQRNESNEPWPYFLFHIDVGGSFTDFLLFLEEVNSRKWIASIDYLEAEKNDEDGVVVKMSIKTYFLEQ